MTKESRITKEQYDKAALVVDQYKRQQKEKKGFFILNYRTKTSGLSLINPIKSIPNSVNSVSMLFVVKRVNKKSNKKSIEAEDYITEFVRENSKSFNEHHQIENKDFNFGKIKTDSVVIINMMGENPLDWESKNHSNLYNTLRFHKNNNNTIIAVTDSVNKKLFDAFSFLFIADYALTPAKRKELINGVTRFSF